MKLCYSLPGICLIPLAALVIAGCGPNGGQNPAGKTAGETLAVVAEDIHTIRGGTVVAGPTIVGSIQPERRADLRAEVPAMVMQLLRENGDPVARGDLLVRLDDTAIRDSLASAESATRTAGQALSQAERQLERLKTLRTSGMATAQALEDAEIRRNNTQSELEAAKARLVSARQQLARTEVRAPFAGVVSDRKVSAGDTAQVGKELLKVIDPTSLRFEGLVSADHIGQVRAGQTVGFRVNGYGDQEFSGQVRRVNPAANVTTRQVEVLVDFSGATYPRLAGLYAEGRIETETRQGLTAPASAISREGDRHFVWAIRDGKVRQLPVTLGERDPRTGDYLVSDGLNAGERILRYPGDRLRDGQPVQESARETAANAAGGGAR